MVHIKADPGATRPPITNIHGNTESFQREVQAQPLARPDIPEKEMADLSKQQKEIIKKLDDTINLVVEEIRKTTVNAKPGSTVYLRQGNSFYE